MNRRSSSGRAGYEQEYRRKNTAPQRRSRPGRIFLIVQAVLSVVFLAALLALNMLPAKYIAMAVMILLFLLSLTFYTQYARQKKAGGKILSLLISACLLISSIYIVQANGVLGKITGAVFKVDKMVVAVLEDDPAETLEDAADYNFGVQFAQDSDNMQSVILTIQDELNNEDLTMTDCGSIASQATMLYSGEVDAIIYNQAYAEVLEEACENYSSGIRIIYSHSIETELSLGITNSNLTQEPFTVYISGIDVYGDIEQTSRSDVNIIAVVNPTTYQILLVTTPRDYYVEIPGVSDGMSDKLTHAGIYGVDASMATLAQLYDTEINYYVRLNFTSLIEIVDELGGVDVESEYAFTTSEASGVVMDVVEGTNHFTGEEALAFARERKNLAEGDIQRGKNQQALITAMLKKALSPTILLKVSAILDEVSDGMETNITQSQINGLVKFQLKKEASWNIKSVSASGTYSTEYCYSASSQALSVILPDDESVQEIIEEVNKVENGEILEDTEALN